MYSAPAGVRPSTLRSIVTVTRIVTSSTHSRRQTAAASSALENICPGRSASAINRSSALSPTDTALPSRLSWRALGNNIKASNAIHSGVSFWGSVTAIPRSGPRTRTYPACCSRLSRHPPPKFEFPLSFYRIPPICIVAQRLRAPASSHHQPCADALSRLPSRAQRPLLYPKYDIDDDLLRGSTSTLRQRSHEENHRSCQENQILQKKLARQCRDRGKSAGGCFHDARR